MYAAATVLLASCSSITYNTRTAKSASLTSSLMEVKTTADLEVAAEKVSANSDDENGRSAKIVFSKEIMEGNAIAKALQASKADILIEPQFVYSYRDGRLERVTVTGYPGYYRNFRTYEEPVCEDECKQQAPQIVIYGSDVIKTAEK